MENCDLSQVIWRKSRRSGATACVEVATVGTVVGVRDSKNPSGPVLRYPTLGWAAFLDGARDGEFDYPN